MADAEISEMALIDSEGDTVIVKTFKPKIKDGGMEMTFQMDDKFQEDDYERLYNRQSGIFQKHRKL